MYTSYMLCGFLPLNIFALNYLKKINEIMNYFPNCSSLMLSWFRSKELVIDSDTLVSLEFLISQSQLNEPFIL